MNDPIETKYDVTFPNGWMSFFGELQRMPGTYLVTEWESDYDEDFGHEVLLLSLEREPQGDKRHYRRYQLCDELPEFGLPLDYYLVDIWSSPGQVDELNVYRMSASQVAEYEEYIG